jgi:hypothetical protein
VWSPLRIAWLLMTQIRAMAVFQGGSGLPADVFVNTFHFVGAGTASEDKILCQDAVGKFYEEVGTPLGVNAVGRYLSAWIQRPYLIKTYDLSEPIVRVPTIFNRTLPAVFSAEGPPEEVAVCVSLHGSVPPASPRRRGRIFIGPLNNTAIVTSTSAHRSGVATELIGDLIASSQRLIATPLVQWSILSRVPTPNMVAIVGGYVDDALDTQRRRGPDTTVRSIILGPG